MGSGRQPAPPACLEMGLRSFPGRGPEIANEAWVDTGLFARRPDSCDLLLRNLVAQTLFDEGYLLQKLAAIVENGKRVHKTQLVERRVIAQVPADAFVAPGIRNEFSEFVEGHGNICVCRKRLSLVKRIDFTVSVQNQLMERGTAKQGK